MEVQSGDSRKDPHHTARVRELAPEGVLRRMNPGVPSSACGVAGFPTSALGFRGRVYHFALEARGSVHAAEYARKWLGMMLVRWPKNLS